MSVVKPILEYLIYQAILKSVLNITSLKRTEARDDIIPFHAIGHECLPREKQNSGKQYDLRSRANQKITATREIRQCWVFKYICIPEFLSGFLPTILVPLIQAEENLSNS